MAVRIGEWDSPGADRRRHAFEKERKQALELAEPQAAEKTRSLFGLDARADALRRIDIAGRPTQSPLAGFGGPPVLNMQPTPVRLGQGLLPPQPGPIRDMATVAQPGDAGPFPFQGGRNPLELASAAASFIGGLPLPGGIGTVLPSVSGGRPGVSISMPRTQTVADVDRFESQIARVTTEPVGRFVGEQAVEALALKLRVQRGAPGREAAVNIGGEVGAFVAGEGIRVSNIIPIPVIDPALAKLIGITVKMGKGVTPGVLEALSRNADSIAKAGGDFAPKARKFVDDVAKALKSERGAATLGPKGSGGSSELSLDEFRQNVSKRVGDEIAERGAVRTPDKIQFDAMESEVRSAIAARRPLGNDVEAFLRDFDKQLEDTTPNLREFGLKRRDEFERALSEHQALRARLQQMREDIVAARPAVAGHVVTLGPPEPPRGAQPPSGFEPEPVRPPAGQEAPLFPELEERAALGANVEAAATQAPGVPGRPIPDLTGAALARGRPGGRALDVPRGVVPEGTAEAARLHERQLEELAGDIEQGVRARQPEPVQQFVGGEDLTGAELDRSIEAMIGRAQAAGADETTTNLLTQTYRDAIELGATQARAPQSLIERRAPRVAALADNLSSKFQGRVQGGVGEIRERAGMVEHALNEVSKPEVDSLVTGINQRLYGRARTGGFLSEITYVGPKEFADAANGQYRDLVLASTPPEYWKGVPDEFYDDLNALRRISQDRKTTAEALGHPSAASRDNYLRQTWEEVDEALRLGADPKRGGLISPSKARIIPNYAIGINAGLTPSQNNVGELLTESIGLWNRAIAESWERKIVLDRYGTKATGRQTLASGQAPFQHPLYKGYTADREIVDMVEGLHKPPGKITRAALGEAATFKNTVFGPLDIGVIGVQGLKAIALDGPIILGNQIVRSLAFIRFAPAVRMRQLLEAGNLPLTVKMASNGLHLGLGPSAITPGQGTVLKYIPLLKRLDPSISAFIDAKARVEFGIILNFLRRQIAEGNMLLLHMTGRDLNDPATWKTGMDWANTMTGASRGAQTPGRRALETAGLTSFQMTRSEMATLGGVVKATLRGTPDERILATATLASFGIMVYGIGSAINMAFGNGPVTFDPRNGKWATVQIGKQNIPLMPSRGLVRAISKSITAIQDMDAEKVTQIWAQYTLSKGGPGIVSPAAGAAGFGFEPDVGFRTGDLPAKFRFLNALPLPPLVSQPLVEQDARGAVPLGFSALGFNPFPESVFERRGEVRNEVSQRLFSQNYDDLDELQQAQVNKERLVGEEQVKIDKLPARDRIGEGFDVSAELRATQQAEQIVDDAALDAETMPGDVWRGRLSDRDRKLFDQREAIFEAFGINFDDEEAKGRVNEAIEAYFAVDFDSFRETDEQGLPTGGVDYSGFSQAQDAALESLTSQEREKFVTLILGKFDTETKAEFRAIRSKLDAAPPQIVGLTKIEREYVLNFRRDALALRRKWQAESGWAGSVQDALSFLGQQWGESEATINWAIALGSTTFKRENVNPDYLSFLYGENESELRRFYPDIFSAAFDVALVR